VQGKSTLGNDEDEVHCCRCWLVTFRLQTHKHLAYNWFLNLPYSIICFTTANVLISLSGGLLAMCCLGVVIFVFTLYCSRAFCDADLTLTNYVSRGVALRGWRPKHVDPEEDGLKGISWALLSNGQSWKDLCYIWLIKFPFALATFVITFLLVMGSIAAIFSIIIFYTCPDCIEYGNVCVGKQEYSKSDTWMDDWKNGTCDGWLIHRVEDCVALFFYWNSNADHFFTSQ